MGRSKAPPETIRPVEEVLAEQERVERSWREAFAEHFPGEEWPGLQLAMARVRTKIAGVRR